MQFYPCFSMRSDDWWRLKYPSLGEIMSWKLTVCPSVKISPCSSDMRRRFSFCRSCPNLPFMFSDIDECNSTKPLTPCDQICENIPGSYNCSCQKGFNIVNGSRCEGIVTILLMFLQMISTGAWISKRWWNVAIKNNWQLGQGTTGLIFSCS